MSLFLVFLFIFLLLWIEIPANGNSLSGQKSASSRGYSASWDSPSDCHQTAIMDDEGYAMGNRSAFDDMDDAFSDTHSDINPATGLPMMGALDAAGNPYGTDSEIGIDSGIDSGIDMGTDSGIGIHDDLFSDMDDPFHD